MDTLAGYVATGIVSLTVGVLTRYLEPKARLVYWLPHNFLFNLKQENVTLMTNSLTIQNIGRRPAQNVEIVHKAKPDFFQLTPALAYTESTNPAGEYVITVASLGPREYFTIQLLSYKTVPQLLNIRSTQGPAAQIAIQAQRVFPWWVNALVAALILLGLGLAAYWVIKLGIWAYGTVATKGAA